MAKGRMLKKEISVSKKLGALKSDSARLLYTWLIPWLDIEGRYTADPDILKGHLFPKIESMTKSKINKLLIELAKMGLIYLYKSDGEQYLQFTKFSEMQTLHKEREAKSEIPSPDDKTCELMITHDLSPQVKLNIIKDKSNINEVNSSCLKKVSNEDKKLTQLLIDLILENDPNSSIIRRLTEKRQIEWMDACRKLREIDKRDPALIEKIIRFSQQDDFWKGNILSMPKLREKFDQLFHKAKKEKFSGIREWLNEE